MWHSYFLLFPNIYGECCEKITIFVSLTESSEIMETVLSAKIKLPSPAPHLNSNSGIDTVVFDLGGVLIDLNVTRCIQNFCALMGKEQVHNILGMNDDAEGIQAASAANRQLMHDYERGLISTDDFFQTILRFCKQGTSLEQTYAAWLSMIDGLPQEKLDYISLLRQAGYKVCLLSNTNQLHWDAVFYAYRLEHYFDSIFASHQLHCAKPEPAIYRLVAHTADARPYTTLFVDDLPKNREAAAEYAGWQTAENIEQIADILAK